MGAAKEITLPKDTPTGAAQHRTALPRLEAITPMLEFRRLQRRGQRPVVILDDRQKIATLDLLATHIAARRQIGRATLWAWYTRFQNLGYEGLAPRPRSDRGVSRYFAAYPDAAAFVKQKAIIEHLSALAIFGLMAANERPTYRTLRDFVRSLKKAAAAARLQRRREHRTGGAA